MLEKIITDLIHSLIQIHELFQKTDMLDKRFL